MEIRDVVDSLNSYIDAVRKERDIKGKGVVMWHKSVTQNKSFKAYKTVEYTLWFVLSPAEKYKLLSVKATDKITDGNCDSSNIHRGFIMGIYAITNTVVFDKLLDDTYKEDKYETIKI